MNAHVGAQVLSFLQPAKLQLLEAVAAVSVKPSPSGIPGGDAAQKLINGAAAFGLMACVATVIIGAAQWGFGSKSSNYSQADDGKTRIMKGVGGAFAIGAAAALINFFFDAGSAIH
jgi:Family of unknown function (DUF6112)